MRKRRDFRRLQGIKSGRLIVIATEGRCTERIYFEGMKGLMCASAVNIEILRQTTGESSPESVMSQVEEFRSEYDIEEDDELWIVVDKDRWTDKMLSDVASRCRKNPDYNFCVSNPCFELWLILHLEDVASYPEEDKKDLAENKKSSKTGPTWTKRRLKKLLGSYSESKYDVAVLLEHVDDAIVRAEALDAPSGGRWPQGIGTRVYLLAKSIIGEATNGANGQDKKNQ